LPTWVQGTTLNILIVDDDAKHGRSVRDLLAAHNYPADVAVSGQEGLAKLQAAAATDAPYQVLILDLHIPDLSGVDILRAINKHEIDVKTIVLSGERELATVTPILRLGALDYLRKPFQVEELLTSVANAIARYQLEQENRVMHREAEESSTLYEFLLNASPDLVYMLDSEGNFRFINNQLEGVFDVDYEELIGSPWQSLLAGHEALAETLDHSFNERRTGVRATIGQEFDYTTDVGSRHNLEYSSIGLYEGRDANQTGDFIGTYGVVRDVTESKRTQRQLLQSQRKFYSLFMDSPDAVFISDLKTGALIESNPNLQRVRAVMAGAEAHDDTDAFIWTDEHPREQFVAGLQSSPEHFETTLVKQINGEPRYFELRARKLEIERADCMVATVRDRSNERRAEQDRLHLQEQMQQASRMEAIGQVAGGIAHDFNNILASIIGYAELIMNARHRFTEEQVNGYLEEVVTAGHRARDLISQMLTFTKAKRGDPHPVDIATTIDDVSRMLRAAIPSTIEILTHYAPGLPSVNVDPVQIQQVIINLLINARDAITGNGVIDLKVDCVQSKLRCQTCGELMHGEHVQITVADDGHGIPEDLLEKVFEMYFTTRDPGKGTGFGLWLINNLIHEYRGHLVVRSEVGKGTTFEVYLPTASNVEVLPELPANVQRVEIDGRIVVVDDEVSVGNYIGEVLRDGGYPTVVFNESPQALNYLEEHLDDVALLLTDGAMPMIDGLELASFVKSQKPGLPVIFITGYAQTTDMQRMRQIGVDKYLEKPFSIEELVDAVAQFTGSTEP
jgi:PAS domain S-box-containing protein